MSYTKNRELSALWLTSPRLAKDTCLLALNTHKTMAEAAAHLRVNLSTLRRWIKDHEIPNRHAHDTREDDEPTLGDSPWPETKQPGETT